MKERNSKELMFREGGREGGGAEEFFVTAVNDS